MLQIRKYTQLTLDERVKTSELRELCVIPHPRFDKAASLANGDTPFILSLLEEERAVKADPMVREGAGCLEGALRSQLVHPSLKGNGLSCP